MYEFDEFDDDDDDDDPRPSSRPAFIAFALALGIGWFLVRPALSGNENSGASIPLVVDTASSESATGVGERPASTSSSTLVAEPSTAGLTDPGEVAPSDAAVPSTTSTTTTFAPTTSTTSTSSTTTTVPPATTSSSTTSSTTLVASTTAAPSTTSTTTIPPTTTSSTTTIPTTTTTSTTTTIPPTTTSTTTSTTTIPPTTSTTTTTTIPPTTTTSTTTTIPPTTVAPSTTASTTATVPAPAVVDAQPPTTLPDGRPVAVTMMFTADQITLTGAVPTESARERLADVASGFSLTSSAISNNLTVDPAASVGAGIRIVEQNSIHFDGDTDAITPAHAEQLDRLVLLMTAFPDVRLHVVGNTDVQGGETRNFVISQRRADAIVNYLVAHGVDRARLTTQPAGESNPITTNPGPVADALNRRTDYVLFGLLDS